jgi:hypothetical protein
MLMKQAPKSSYFKNRRYITANISIINLLSSAFDVKKTKQLLETLEQVQDSFSLRNERMGQIG